MDNSSLRVFVERDAIKDFLFDIFTEEFKNIINTKEVLTVDPSTITSKRCTCLDSSGRRYSIRWDWLSLSNGYPIHQHCR